MQLHWIRDRVVTRTGKSRHLSGVTQHYEVSMRKREHSSEFRERAVKQAETGAESIKEISAGLGISYGTLEKWRQRFWERGLA